MYLWGGWAELINRRFTLRQHLFLPGITSVVCYHFFKLNRVPSSTLAKKWHKHRQLVCLLNISFHHRCLKTNFIFLFRTLTRYSDSFAKLKPEQIDCPLVAGCLVTTAQALAANVFSRVRRQCSHFGIFWLPFCTVEGSGNVLPVRPCFLSLLCSPC